VRCVRPKIISVGAHRGHLVLQVRGAPSGCRLQARLLVRRGLGASWRLTPSVGSTRLVLPSVSFSRLQVRYVRPSEAEASSRWVGVNIRQRHR
jgi:hypothetical protein